MSTTEVLFGLLVATTQLIEAIAGFGSTVMALPFAISLVGVSVAVPVLSLLSWLLAARVVATDYKKIQWQQYRTVMLFALLGLPFGIGSSQFYRKPP